MVKVNLINCFSQWLCDGNLHITSPKFIIQKLAQHKKYSFKELFNYNTYKVLKGKKRKF